MKGGGGYQDWGAGGQGLCMKKWFTGAWGQLTDDFCLPNSSARERDQILPLVCDDKRHPT